MGVGGGSINLSSIVPTKLSLEPLVCIDCKNKVESAQQCKIIIYIVVGLILIFLIVILITVALYNGNNYGSDDS